MSSFTLKIDQIAGLGDGFGFVDGTRIFVAKSSIGDVLEVREISRKKDSARAEIVKIITAGRDRISAPCQHYTECGGCSLQHLSHDSYQQFKRDVVNSALGYAGFPDIKANFHFLPPETRRRADFKVEDGKLAYVSYASHKKVPISNCLILLPELNDLIAAINKILPKFKNVQTLAMTRADSGIDILLGVNSSLGGLEIYQSFLDDLSENFPIARLSVEWPSRNIEMLAQKDLVIMQIAGHDVPIPADAFLQASAEAQDIITSLVKKATNLASPIVDLFCGIGTYSFPMSEKARVHAVDNNGRMIDHIRGISKKVSVAKRDLFLNPLTKDELNKFKAAVINPPRMGASAQIKQLALSNIPKIIMVSCNHATWSRDAASLRNAGYRLVTLDVIDQFVYSPHVELVSIFEK